jgi:hypothetical protein
VEVTAETTAQACRRLAENEGERPTALNFASAKNPGGGSSETPRRRRRTSHECPHCIRAC